jgi:hypothetical protein
MNLEAHGPAAPRTDLASRSNAAPGIDSCTRRGDPHPHGLTHSCHPNEQRPLVGGPGACAAFVGIRTRLAPTVRSATGPRAGHVFMNNPGYGGPDSAAAV